MSSKPDIDERIRRLTHGEAADFGAFYEAQQARIRSLAFRILGADELDDAVQEAFVKIWQKLESFDGRSRLSTWCYRVALNVALDRLRARKRATPHEELSERLGREASQETQLAGKDLVTRAMDRLDEKHRSVFVLHVFEELGLAEIAQILEIPEGTVKSRLFHARKELALYLEKEGVSDEARPNR